jgi:dTDP-4-dehydrorhamnose 3,5-epimerase
MTSGWQPLEINGAWRRRVTFHADERGSFGELWRASWLDDLPGRAEADMRQANLSSSRPGVLRGLHMHLRQADLWLVVEGNPLVALVDVRPLLEDRGPARPLTLEASPGDAFYLPIGVSHGFYAPDALTLIYLVTNEYDGTDELGFAWDDPASGIEWPTSDPILSERDQANPTLAELVESLRQQSVER